jgi:hypothetical protein
MSSGSITSTTNTFGMIPGTLTGSVGVPGPAGAAGAPGVGVPAGGTAGQYLQKTTTGVDYATDWVTLNLGNYALLSGADFTGRVTVPGITGDEIVNFPGFNIVPTQTEPTDKVNGDLWVYDDEGLTPSKFRVFLESETQNIATESWVSTSFAPKASPVFTGDPRAPTPASGDNDTSIATTAFVKVQGYITSAALTGYAPLASPVFTGNPTAPTPTFGDNDTSIATTAFVQSALLGGTAVARNLEVEVRNQSGSTIAAGSIVYISGATGNKPLITLAQANNDTNSAQTIGFVKTSIANNGTGYVIVRGELENIDTSALTEGVQLYLSPTTAGTWTTTKPSAPQHLVYVGIVIRSHPTLGTILVAVQNGYELDELHDVAISSPTNGQVLKYDSTTSLWKNQTDAVGAVTSVAGRTGAVTLSNTDISGLGTMATATATDYLSKAGNLSGLANTGTARTNLGLGTIATFNDAPSDGSQYARKNGAWDVVTGGGGSFTGGAITSPITYTVGTQVSTMANTAFSVANSATSESIDVNVTGINITSDAAAIYLNGDFARIDVNGVYGLVTIDSGGIRYPDSSYQSTAGIGDAPADGAKYVRKDSAWVSPTYIEDAPADGNYYVRKDNAWYACTVAEIYDNNSDLRNVLCI